MPDEDVLASMRKSVALLGVAGAVALLTTVALLTVSRSAWGGFAAGALALGASAALGLAASGRLVLERQRRLFAGQPDLFLLRNACRAEAAVLAGRVSTPGHVRRWLALRLFGHRFVVGQRVRVRSLQAIRASLDDTQATAGMPFMDEMVRWCGYTARVFRVVDKIYDYGRSRKMRRLDGSVLLAGLRCDGSAHGQCEAACYLIWKTEWLQVVDEDECADDRGTVEPQSVKRAPVDPPYHCQYTALTAASSPISANTLRGTLGPWLVGNVTAASVATALATRAFNAFQRWRGGAAYPAALPSDGKLAEAAAPVQTGDWVRIRPAHEIARTLDRNSKHRGLWFDRDMLKFCGQRFQVRGRVDQIIDVTTQRMVTMKTPCIVLHDVHYTGEFQGFGEQHDFLYWREAWLQPAPGPAR